MHERCGHPKHHRYAEYGGRGITIDPDWYDFANFLRDMGERPLGTTIDRIDNDGDYRPGNCRWSAAAEQRSNRREPKLDLTKAIEIVRRCKAGERQNAVAREFGVNPSIVANIMAGRVWSEAVRQFS